MDIRQDRTRPVRADGYNAVSMIDEMASPITSDDAVRIREAAIRDVHLES
ncbi:MAG: hypothetical protein GY906_35205 [bacterium]|nr:hypothetical protein [bacterium]